MDSTNGGSANGGPTNGGSGNGGSGNGGSAQIRNGFALACLSSTLGLYRLTLVNLLSGPDGPDNRLVAFGGFY